MFTLLAILLISLAWAAGQLFAGRFQASRPKKIYAFIFSLVCGPTILALLVIIRHFGSLFITQGESVLSTKDIGLAPFDPPFLFLYVFLSYGGAISFYKSPKKTNR